MGESIKGLRGPTCAGHIPRSRRGSGADEVGTRRELGGLIFVTLGSG